MELSNRDKETILNALGSYLFCINYLLPNNKKITEQEKLYFEVEKTYCIDLIHLFKE